jgi:hypothetical protein
MTGLLIHDRGPSVHPATLSWRFVAAWFDNGKILCCTSGPSESVVRDQIDLWRRRRNDSCDRNLTILNDSKP